MTESSQAVSTSARKFESELLRRVAEVQYEVICNRLSIDKSNVSRIFSGERGVKVHEIPTLLEVLGWKVVDRAQVCVPREVFEAYRTIAKTAMNQPSQLEWGEADL